MYNFSIFSRKIDFRVPLLIVISIFYSPAICVQILKFMIRDSVPIFEGEKILLCKLLSARTRTRIFANNVCMYPFLCLCFIKLLQISNRTAQYQEVVIIFLRQECELTVLLFLRIFILFTYFRNENC